MHNINKSLIRKVKRHDRIARWVITLAGVTIIAGVVAILLLIVSVTVPLFRSAKITLRAQTTLPERLPEKDVLALGVDFVELGPRAGRDSLTAYTLSRNGKFTFFDLQGNNNERKILGHEQAIPPGGSKSRELVSIERFANSSYSLLWSDGSASLVEVVLAPHFDAAGRRSVKHELHTKAELPGQGNLMPLKALVRQSDEGATTFVKLLPENKISIIRKSTSENLLGETETQTSQLMIEDDLPGPISALTMDRSGKTLYAGTSNGCLLRWELGEEGKIDYREVVRAFRDDRAITSLAMLFGDVSLAVGDEKGELTTWFEIRNENSRKLRLIHRLTKHNQPVMDILPSSRNKSLLSLDGSGSVNLDYATNEKHLLTLSDSEPLLKIGYSPRGNAMIALDKHSRLRVWKIDCPHPEISFAALFGKLHYEGYQEPAYKWQTTGEEPKFSLVPVIFGTLKSTFYAMFFAVPLALSGAIYASYFTTPRFKRAIKPVVEIMAAAPSVVIGFLILLWLAPLMGKWLPAVFISMLTIPVTFIIFMIVWQQLRKFDCIKRLEQGYEFLMLMPVIILGVLPAVWLSQPVEQLVFQGDFKQWLFNVMRKPYDPLNSLVVAFGLGLAVIPVIFSIAEDSLSSIPHNLTAASLVMGASRWQTLWRVVLPSASPGIFAAVMIGFGRAVGETMIVFMATGNTPILDFSPFNGFRTLSANIAVEITEAPMGGTLYRVLFLCAVLLFLLTFLLNTLAELVRQHLRNRYGRY
ncbi:MAG: ABC transporter permease subunit [Thermoguttaceae bacterium]